MMRVVATAGHVDHGKSTLLRALTGMEPDRWEEERRRGLTIDLGFVWTTLEGPEGPMTVAFVDVPGHQRFVPNMLAGAGSVTAALLVVAADDGWSAQTSEHVAILDLLAVRGVVTAITKSSLVGASRISEVMAEVSGRLEGTTLQDAPMVVVDGVTGHGLPELAELLTGRLAKIPASVGMGTRRLWIDRVFTVPGAGTVVTGTLQGGTLTVGQEVSHAPSGQTFRIRGLHALGEPVDQASAGTRVAVNLARVAVHELARGDALLDDDWLTTSTVDVMLQATSHGPIGARGAWHLHVGSAEVPVRVRPLLDEIPPGERGPARLDLVHALPLRHGDRFVLRAVGARATAAGGQVLDPAPGPRAKGMIARLELAEKLETLDAGADPQDRLAALLQLHDGHMLQQRARASLELPDDLSHEAVVPLGEALVLAHTLTAWEQAAYDVVRDARPERGVYLTEVAAAMGRAGCPEPLRRTLIERLTANQQLHAQGDILTDPVSTATYLDARARRQAAVMEAMSRDPLSPPDLDQVTRATGMVGAELQELFDVGELLQLGDVVVASTAVERARRLLRERLADEAFTASEAREVWQTTRKYALPMLEHLARVGTTTFDGTHHHLAAIVDGSRRPPPTQEPASVVDDSGRALPAERRRPR